MECEHEWHCLTVVMTNGKPSLVMKRVDICSKCQEKKTWGRPWVENRPFNWIGPVDALAHLLRPEPEHINFMDE